MPHNGKQPGDIVLMASLGHNAKANASGHRLTRAYEFVLVKPAESNLNNKR